MHPRNNLASRLSAHRTCIALQVKPLDEAVRCEGFATDALIMFKSDVNTSPSLVLTLVLPLQLFGKIKRDNKIVSSAPMLVPTGKKPGVKDLMQFLSKVPRATFFTKAQPGAKEKGKPVPVSGFATVLIYLNALQVAAEMKHQGSPKEAPTLKSWLVNKWVPFSVTVKEASEGTSAPPWPELCIAAQTRRFLPFPENSEAAKTWVSLTTPKVIYSPTVTYYI